jgi:hypothetical protein
VVTGPIAPTCRIIYVGLIGVVNEKCLKIRLHQAIAKYSRKFTPAREEVQSGRMYTSALVANAFAHKYVVILT